MTLPERIGVYGGGRMGAGIAHAFLASGAAVVIVERDPSAVRAARERVIKSLERASERGTLDAPPDDVARRLQVTVEAGDLAAASLVIEAVPEDLDVKARVLATVHDVAPDAVVATNTSSLSIDALAATFPDPPSLIGLHFFNPVPASDLVEIVIGTQTRPDLAEQAQQWVTALGKTAITVADSPGFASSRLGVALALEAIRMVEEGVTSAEDVDTAMTLGYRHPVGPLRTTDIVGLDIRLAIAEHLEEELGPRFAPPQLLRDMVAASTIGRKAGQGFYTW